MCNYLEATNDLPLILRADGIQVIKWYVDVYFTVHHEIISHNRIMMNLGKGCVYSLYGKKNINIKSSTETELVGVSNALPQVLCIQYLIQSQVIVGTITYPYC